MISVVGVRIRWGCGSGGVVDPMGEGVGGWMMIAVEVLEDESGKKLLQTCTMSLVYSRPRLSRSGSYLGSFSSLQDRDREDNFLLLQGSFLWKTFGASIVPVGKPLGKPLVQVSSLQIIRYEVIAKLSTRLSKWKLKSLSIGGRLTLIKSVLSSLPLYYMSSFKVPKGVLSKMESIRRNFFNGVENAEKKMSLIGWNKILASKKNGGLGVSSFFAYNRALLFKWIWRFLANGASLWSRFISAIYGIRGALDNSSSYSRRSPWLDIVNEVRKLASKGIDLLSLVKKKVGNGEATSFWNDVWLGDFPLKQTSELGDLCMNQAIYAQTIYALGLNQAIYALGLNQAIYALGLNQLIWNANPLSLVATTQQYPKYHNQAPKPYKSIAHSSKQTITSKSHASTRYKGKEIAKPIKPPSESASDEDSDPEQAQRDKQLQKNLALIAKYIKNIYSKPTNNNLRASSNTRNKNMETTPRSRNNKNTRHMAKECIKPKWVKDYVYHKEKMLLCKEAEKGVPLSADQGDWLDDTDEEPDE
ncbi:hypothetical protein Tco_0967503 [Tanacetum coccineum]